MMQRESGLSFYRSIDAVLKRPRKCARDNREHFIVDFENAAIFVLRYIDIRDAILFLSRKIKLLNKAAGINDRAYFV